MNELMASFKQTIEDITAQATQADMQLATLNQAGMGKFNHIMSQDSGFVVRSNRFQPYVLELTEQYLSLEAMSPEQQKTQIPVMVKKMEVLLRTLVQLQQSIDAENKAHAEQK